MYFDQLEVGMTVDTAPAAIEKEKMLEFARVYDNVPLHTDENYAKSTPFGRLLAPGVMSFLEVWAKLSGLHTSAMSTGRRRADRTLFLLIISLD